MIDSPRSNSPVMGIVTWKLITFVAGALLFASGTPAQTTRPVSELKGIDGSRLIIWIAASQSGWDTPRGLHPALIAGGWRQFDREVIAPDVEFAKKLSKRVRLLIHNPYGLERETAYSITQRRDCQNDLKTSHVAHGLEDVLRKYRNEGHEVIVYTGRPETTGAITAETIEEWLWNLREATRSGASIALDDSSGYMPTDPRSRFTDLLREILKPFNANIYVEARPTKWATNLHGDRWIIQDQLNEQFDPGKTPSAVPWAAPDQVLTGERTRYLQFPDDDETGTGWGGSIENRAVRMVKGIRRIQAAGHTAAASVADLRATYK